MGDWYVQIFPKVHINNVKWENQVPIYNSTLIMFQDTTWDNKREEINGSHAQKCLCILNWWLRRMKQPWSKPTPLS